MVGPIYVYFSQLLQFRRWFAVIKCRALFDGVVCIMLFVKSPPWGSEKIKMPPKRDRDDNITASTKKFKVSTLMYRLRHHPLQVVLRTNVQHWQEGS
jgi:hypothetical protein